MTQNKKTLESDPVLIGIYGEVVILFVRLVRRRTHTIDVALQIFQIVTRYVESRVYDHIVNDDVQVRILVWMCDWIWNISEPIFRWTSFPHLQPLRLRSSGNELPLHEARSW
jgi:hypothetical protein